MAIVWVGVGLQCGGSAVQEIQYRHGMASRTKLAFLGPSGVVIAQHTPVQWKQQRLALFFLQGIGVQTFHRHL